MKIFRFDLESGQGEGQFGSVKAIIARAVQLDNEAKVNAVYLHPDRNIIEPQALTQQLFLIVEGDGWVKGESDNELAIRQGQALFWEIAEPHELGTETGITAVIIECVNVDSAELMPLLQEYEP